MGVASSHVTSLCVLSSVRDLFVVVAARARTACPLRSSAPSPQPTAHPPTHRRLGAQHNLRTRSFGCGHAASRPQRHGGSVSRSSAPQRRSASPPPRRSALSGTRRQAAGRCPHRPPPCFGLSQLSSGGLVRRLDLLRHRHRHLHHGAGPGARPVPAARLPAGRAAPPAGGWWVLLPAERRVQRQREGLHR